MVGREVKEVWWVGSSKRRWYEGHRRWYEGHRGGGMKVKEMVVRRSRDSGKKVKRRW